jgi:hypothetical protein
VVHKEEVIWKDDDVVIGRISSTGICVRFSVECIRAEVSVCTV